jgi:hypothetical protein
MQIDMFIYSRVLYNEYNELIIGVNSNYEVIKGL